jgi:hypothetical protein
MPFASSDRNRPGRRLRPGLLALAALLLAFAAGGTGAGAGTNAPFASFQTHRIAEGSLSAENQRKLRASAWQGGAYTVSTGESVRVLVSESYPDAQVVGQTWADFFASLLHGNELALVTAYVLTPTEMRFFCGAYALGCYGGNELAFMGEMFAGVTPEEVARHEYGHHIAANRLNPPWRAVDWGPKRWASVANTCLRAQQGAVFPGNEDKYYELNPGEGFAEVYRVLSEIRSGASSFTWSLVDPSFAPDVTALQAAEQDVVAPWTAPVTQSYRARFTRNGKTVWKMSVATPLDGNLAVSLTFPRGALHELAVLAPDGRKVLARGLWAGGSEKRVASTVCGARSLVLRVTRRGPIGPFSLRVTHD